MSDHSSRTAALLQSHCSSALVAAPSASSQLLLSPSARRPLDYSGTPRAASPQPPQTHVPHRTSLHAPDTPPVGLEALQQPTGCVSGGRVRGRVMKTSQGTCHGDVLRGRVTGTCPVAGRHRDASDKVAAGHVTSQTNGPNGGYTSGPASERGAGAICANGARWPCGWRLAIRACQPKAGQPKRPGECLRNRSASLVQKRALTRFEPRSRMPPQSRAA